MIKLIVLASIIFSLALLSASSATEIHVISEQAHIDLKTHKVAHILGSIDPATAAFFLFEMSITSDLPGDRLIIIDSPGGRTDSGIAMIGAIREEQKAKVRVVCVVDARASSMAFDLLSWCDVRLAVPKARMLMHSVAVIFNANERLTQRILRLQLDSVAKADAYFDPKNMEALNMSKEDYELFCDEEHIWTTATLLDRKYLHGVATIVK